jgi:hypothetical protein
MSREGRGKEYPLAHIPRFPECGERNFGVGGDERKQEGGRTRAAAAKR